ncbi:hypothetical protein CSA37_02195 [Candidatus Fermentibacteria bacterium]|nr:MAG: hypothetical protein CSA37_02195 [Candidatus Fermentibacteria bacterium]
MVVNQITFSILRVLPFQCDSGYLPCLTLKLHLWKENTFVNWDILINPSACAGSAGRHWPSVKEELSSREITFTAHFTDAPERTRSIIADIASRGARAVAVYGGDGTLSDAAAVLSSLPSPPALAVLPAGSGNDWARSIGLEHPDITSALEVMKNYSISLVDTAAAVWENGSRFFLNSSGIGLDAIVLHRALTMRKYIPLPKLSYILSLAGSAVKPPVLNGRFTVDGEEFFSGSFLTFTVGVGSYSGGGMRLSPAAKPDDGLLDGLCLTEMGLLTIMRNLGRVFDGTLHSTEWAKPAQGKVLRFENSNPGSFLLEADGEPVPIGNSRWLELHVKPESLRVVTPASTEE